jgi:arsenate reductase-like glutaredoxin family protein
MNNPLSLNKVLLIILIAIATTFSSCGSATPATIQAQPDVANILDEEIRRFEDAGIIHIESTYYNPHIKGFLTAYSEGDRKTTDQLKSILTVSEIKSILNPAELNHLIQQLNDPGKVPSTSIMTSRKVLLQDLNARGEQNVKNNQRLLNIEKDRMIISTPIFTRDKEFALIDVSKGKLNNMYTTINLYQREGNSYVFYKTLLGYME